MKKLFSTMVVTLLAFSGVTAQNANPFKVTTYTLENGMTVWLNEDPYQTGVYGAVVVKAGAVDCPGTGIAHYFEHMMFKGTENIGTIDYQAEKPYLDSIVVLYDQLALTQEADAKKAIQMEINRLNIKASEYVIPNEFDNLIAEMGGSGLNAFTSYDETIYHNMFLPEYMEQWCELNSERLISPVFRLFQSELETVYEEKNRFNDNLASDFQIKAFKYGAAGTGYEEPILGTTENLKNPSLSQMTEFYKKYYVGRNMGLILTGNFNAEQAIPIIERTFGRIRKGDPIERKPQVVKPYEGVVNVGCKINVPLVKIAAVFFQGPTKCDADYPKVAFMASLFNNDAGTGILDKLMVEGDVMIAMAMTDFSFKDMGTFGILYAPKILVQKEPKAKEKIFEALNRLKTGDFTDEYFESSKQAYKKQLLMGLESQEDRMLEMAYAFSEGISWETVLSRAQVIDAMTKQDLIDLANKYITDNYLHIVSDKGVAKQDNLEKPGYDQVVPENRLAESAYAKKMRAQAAHIRVTPKEVDFVNGAEIRQVAPLVKLYASENPYNDIFNLTLSFNRGTLEEPALERVVAYASRLGTTNRTYDEVHGTLLSLGSNLSLSADENTFKINMAGFDENMLPTLEIAADLMKNLKADNKKLKLCKSDEKASNKMMVSDMDELASALQEKVLYGDNSHYLADKGDFKSEYLLNLFKEIQTVECDITYSGTLSANQVSDMIRQYINVDDVTVKCDGPTEFQVVQYDKPQIFFYDKSDAVQSQIRHIMAIGTLPTQRDRYMGAFYTSYLGGGMSSLLFQEIREFRSMAYSTYARLNRPSFFKTGTYQSSMQSFVGTQSDKTFEAMTIVDSLVMKTAPSSPEKVKITSKEMLSRRCIGYPTFRDMPDYIVGSLRDGFKSDGVDDFMYVIDNASVGSLQDYWNAHIKGHPSVWAIVGSTKRVDMSKFAPWGTVTILKQKDLFKF